MLDFLKRGERGKKEKKGKKVCAERDEYWRLHWMRKELVKIRREAGISTLVSQSFDACLDTYLL